MSELLTWMVFQAAVCYGRKEWGTPARPRDVTETGRYQYHYDLVWRLQRELGAPPVGLIRSC